MFTLAYYEKSDFFLLEAVEKLSQQQAIPGGVERDGEIEREEIKNAKNFSNSLFN